jgi:hypothetical protein
MKNEIEDQTAPSGDFILHNDEHVHHYQRERASITGLGL